MFVSYNENSTLDIGYVIYHNRMFLRKHKNCRNQNKYNLSYCNIYHSINFVYVLINFAAFCVEKLLYLSILNFKKVMKPICAK